MATRHPKAAQLLGRITGQLMRRHTTAAVLFHHAVAERLGLGPTDLKCLDVLRERGPMSGSELAAATALTTGAITGVVARLVDAGYLRRQANPADGRKQILSVHVDHAHSIHDIFKRVRDEHAAALAGVSVRDLAAIAAFLERSAEVIYEQTALLRAEIGMPR